MKIEDFGSPVVVVRATTTTGWDHLVAVLTATTPTGKQIVVSAGAVPTRPGTRTCTIPLFSQITAIPVGSRLEVTFGSSTAGHGRGAPLSRLPADRLSHAHRCERRRPPRGHDQAGLLTAHIAAPGRNLGASACTASQPPVPCVGATLAGFSGTTNKVVVRT